MRHVKVSLGDRSYEIHIGAGLLDAVGKVCGKLPIARRCAIISDSNVFPRYGRPVEQSLKQAGFETVHITFRAGEASKNLRSVEACYDALAKHRLERKSFVVALGGGVTGDLAGFVAATYLRGMAFVQIPTTLLAQVDSSVGGKVGVNLTAGKNLVGAFHQPKIVLCDLDALKTLPAREYHSGLAEVIKYGIIYDAAFFRKLEKIMPLLMNRDTKALADVVARCCEIKADVVSQDETETGLRAILNFGHTIGHAIEAVSGYGKYLHGEAISIGQIAAARISTRLTGLSVEEERRIAAIFTAASLPTGIKLNGPKFKSLLDAMKLDKKVSGGEIKFVLAKKIGEVVCGQKVPVEMIGEALGIKP
jgi:3-dehydroquinate synthase